MTKHEALKDLSAVLREGPVKLPRIESGPAPLTTAQAYVNSNPVTSSATSRSSLFAQLLPSLTGVASGDSGGSLLSGLLGGGASSGLAGGASLGLAPLVSGLLGLFGRSQKSAQAPLPIYSAPQRQQLQASLQGGVVRGADSNQSGMPRVSEGAARTNTSGSQPQVTLHIQAMDTQSILNRSSDIAQAVRQAMLQSHPINDVVADL